MYESPIQTICDEIKLKMDNEVASAVQQLGIVVDKEELIKALKYDRRQYSRGYIDGLLDAIKHARWEDKYFDGDWRCSICGAIVEKDEQSSHYYNYCYHCGAKMDLVGDDNE